MIDGAHLVGAGGTIGAVLRYTVGKQVATRDIPWGTAVVNVAGSFVLALLTVLALDSRLLLFLGTGACGSFTTFSSFSVETVQLWKSGKRGTALGYAGGTFVAAATAIGLAWVVGGALRASFGL